MAIDETGLTKGLRRKLNALRKLSVTTSPKRSSQSGRSAQATSQAKDKPDPVAMKIVEALAGLENDPKFNLGNHGYHTAPRQGQGRLGFCSIQE